MSTKTIDLTRPTENKSKITNQKLTMILLYGGIISSLLYVFMNIITPVMYEGYSVFSQTVSELSAVDAPTRTLWVSLGIFYSVFLIAFGVGVWLSGKDNRRLRIIASLIMLSTFFGMFWPPMHQREVLAAGGGTTTDTLHIAFTILVVPLVMIAIGIAASLFGKGFRIFSILTIIFMLGFGALTGILSPAMENNEPTPWMGIWERIGIGAQMLWIIVFANLLLRRLGNR